MEAQKIAKVMRIADNFVNIFGMDMDAKKRKLDFTIKSCVGACCICGDPSEGMTDVFSISLREDQGRIKPFSEIFSFALGIEVSL